MPAIEVKNVFYELPNGQRLPVLDISRPEFTASIDETKLERLLQEIENRGEQRAENFKKMPAWLKAFFCRHSYVMADMLGGDRPDKFLSGMSTLLLKLGPRHAGRGRFFDRLAARGVGAVMLRMRLVDMCRCQSQILLPQLRRDPGRGLCFVNIGGGAGADSINTLVRIQEAAPELLAGRTLEINVLDIDDFGPQIAARSVAALLGAGGRFQGLDLRLRHIAADWADPAPLQRLLGERREWLQICASEGGLFEYGSDDDICRVLDLLLGHAAPEAAVVGSLMRDRATIDASAVAAMRITRIKARLLGRPGLEAILARSGWRLTSMLEGNPRYLVFTLGRPAA